MPESTDQSRRRVVLITRPREDAARTASLIAARGFIPLAAPFLEVRHQAPVAAPAVQAILVTSGNALPGLAVQPIPLLAVGDTTADRARAAGFMDVSSAGRDAEALVELAARKLLPQGGPLLLACGAGQGGAVAKSLRASGFRVLRRVTYAAIPVRAFPAEATAALQAGTVHAALFMSAETARAFARRLPSAMRASLENVLALAIGKPCADALEPLPWRQVRLARSPTLDDVLAQL